MTMTMTSTITILSMPVRDPNQANGNRVEVGGDTGTVQNL